MMDRTADHRILIVLSVALTALGSACTPKYPKCERDDHCKKGELCVNGLCQQCRTDKDCGSGKRCKGGRCERSPGLCEADAECGAGGRCRDGKCLKPGLCETHADCPENHECIKGTCVAPPAGGTATAARCQPGPVYFGFDAFVLTSEAARILQKNAECIRSVPERPLRLEGHCDPRGTQEYNLALGDHRARVVARYLMRLGIPGGRLRVVSKGELEAAGTGESSWASDRKVKFIWE